MSFQSIHFIFLFFPITLLLYYLLPFSNWRNGILVATSLFFFGWVDPSHLFLLIGVIFFNYLFGLIIGKLQENPKQRLNYFVLWFSILANLSLLFFYKYLGFFGEEIQLLFNKHLNLPEVFLPLGISYFTFSNLSYIVDVYQGDEKPEKNILRFASYLIMFPKLVQGPITRFGQVKTTLVHSQFSSQNIINGIRRFISGLAKKVIIADSMAVVVKKVFDTSFGDLGADVAWFGLIAFTFQIYFDFSGYSDMAIGIAKIFGFSLPENFNFPYICKSISDFWRRWHMSLTSWFRTYLFIPLEFKRKKVKHFRQQTNLILVFLATGLWHGASWNYLIWGGYFGLILSIESLGWGKKLKKWPSVFQHVYSMLCVMIGWIFFRLSDISQWGPFFKALLGGNGWTGIETMRTLNILFYIPIALLGFYFCLPATSKIVSKFSSKNLVSCVFLDILYLCVFLLCICSILSNSFVSFLYMQF